MQLSVREAAALLDCSPRTLRAQLQRGELSGVKRGGRWRIDRRALRLDEAQRRRLQERADQIRQSVDDVLPSRVAGRAGQRRRSLADLDAFRHGGEVLRQVRTTQAPEISVDLRERVAEHLEAALFSLAEAALHFDRTAKLEAVGRCRSGLARAVALLLLDGSEPPADPVHGWVEALEGEVLPAVSGFARWAERLRKDSP